MEYRYTVQDASARVMDAMDGSLRNDRVTMEYLIALNDLLYDWREAVKTAIMQWPDSANL